MNHKRCALYTGTFDPFTKGHLDIVKRALELFDSIIVLVAKPPNKVSIFSSEERLEMIKEIFSDEKKVKVESWNGLVVDYAKKNDLHFIVRGLRPTGDFEVEFQMAAMNKNLYPALDTVFLMTGSEYYFVSSSLVKEIYMHGGDVAHLVPPSIQKHLLMKNKKTIK